MKIFDTGATRDNDVEKLDYEGFLSPRVLLRFAQYMHKHQQQSDGTLRASDNWQKGIPLEHYMKSGFRHFMDWWYLYRNNDRATDTAGVEDVLCALMFNVMGYLHELIRSRPDKP